jgi:hypothetical protein
MTKTPDLRQDYEAKLRQLGFPEEVLNESAAARDLGLFDMEPASGLVQRTIERCRGLLLQDAAPASPGIDPKHGSLDPLVARVSTSLGALKRANAEVAVTLGTISGVKVACTDSAELFRLERLPVECLATVGFARSSGQPPMMIVDNHNLVEPTWWDVDSGFRAVRSACKVVNTIVQDSGDPPAAVVMVLREDINGYSEQDMTAISNLLCTSLSDIWMIPYEDAGMFKKQDVIVLGEERVLKLEAKAQSAGEAFLAFREMEGTAIANTQRHSIEEITGRAIQIRHRGKLTSIAQGAGSVEGARALISGVMTQSTGATRDSW